MALKPLNSVGGFSVGEVPANVILANADITANNATFSGNVLISNSTNTWGVLTDNLYYSNGTPWDFQQAAGSNGEIQYNMGDDFAASANFVWDQANNVLNITGNANISGTLNVGNITTSSLANGNSNVSIPVANSNVNISVAGNANVLVVSGTGVDVAGYIDATGTITGANLALDDGNIVSLGTSGLYLTPANSTAGIVLQSNTTPNANNSFNLGSTSKVFANIYSNNINVTSNVNAGNANLGNLATVNYANITNDINVIENVNTGNIQVNVSANLSNIAVANFVVSNLTPTSDDQYSLGTTTKRWKDINIAGNANIATANISGNITAGNIEFGNLLTGNYATFDNDIQVLGNIANANNVSITNALNGNTANFSGNITSLNANLGNLATANYLNVAQNVDINGSLDATNANFVGNIAISNSNPAYGLLTDNLYYANGQPWDLQEAAGSNTQVQFNDNNDFGASANFTFNTATDTLTVTGNANVTGAVNTANINSDTSNLNLTANGYTTVYENNGNVTFPGNVIAGTFYGNVEANITITAANTTVLFSDDGLVDGTTAFTFDKLSNVVSISGNVELGLAGDNQLINLSNTSLEIRGGWDAATGSGVNIVAGDYNNASNWGKLAILGNYSGNSVGFAESNAFVFTNPGYGAGNVVRVDTLNTAAANTTSGALQVAGGLGVTGNGYFGNLSVTGDIANANNISVTNTLNAVTGNFSGNVNALNANLGNLVEANYVNVASNVTSNNVSVNLALTGNTANFSGNVILPNLQVNSEIVGNTANFSGEVTFNGSNVNVTYNLEANTANFGGNVTTLNANLGNLATANFVNVTSNLHTANANVTGTLTVANANISSNLTVNNLTVNLDLSGNTANFTGNVVLSGANVTVNNHLSGNTANFSSNITSLNANLGNLVDANFIRTGELMNGNSNIIIAPNGNISLSATGTSNVFVLSNLGANITGYVTANGDGSFGAVKSNSVTAQGGNLTLYAAAGDNYVELRPTGNGHVDVANHRIENLATPVASTDAATKGYVDAAVEGLHVHAPCVAATPDTLANISSGTVSYNNGSSGVGANLVTTGSYTLIDGVNIATVGTRILVKDEANAAWNGIYTYANSTTLVRATDYDTPTEMAGGDFTFVQNGTLYNDTGWVMTDPVLVVGTDPVNWLQFSGAGEYTAGAGLTLTGTVFSVNVDNVTTEIAGGNVVVKANAQLTTPNIGAATGTSLDLTGNLLAGNVNSNALVSAANVNVTANVLAGNLTANANLLVNNATVNLELSGNTANFSGNVIVPNLTVNTTLSGNVANFSGNLTSLNANLGNLATANYINVANLITTVDANVTGTLTVANANIGGNITVNNLTVNLELAGNTANFSGNVILSNLTVNLELQANTANFDGNVVMDSWLTVSNTANVGNLRTDNLLYSNGQPWDFQLPAGSNTQVQYNDGAGSFGASANFTFDAATSTLAVTGNANISQDLNGNVGSFTGNMTVNNLLSNGLANVGNLYVVSNVTSDLLPNANLTLDLGAADQRWDNVYAGNVNASGNITINGNNVTTGNITANNIKANNKVNVGNSAINWAEVTTTSIAANQTISTVSISGVTGIEWIVKGMDSSGAKYSMAIVTAVSDGANADYSQFGGVNLGSTTGTLAVNVVGSNVELQVTPSSSNSTVWVTQYRTI